MADYRSCVCIGCRFPQLPTSTLTTATLALITNSRFLSSFSLASDNVVISRQLAICSKSSIYHTSPRPSPSILNFCRATTNTCTRSFFAWAPAYTRRASYTSAPKPLRRRSASPLVLSAAEREWLQVEDSEENNSHFHEKNEKDRFDWSLRAPSRSRKPPDRPPRGFVKRYPPPNVDVQMDEPFFDAITAYKNK